MLKLLQTIKAKYWKLNCRVDIIIYVKDITDQSKTIMPNVLSLHFIALMWHTSAESLSLLSTIDFSLLL